MRVTAVVRGVQDSRRLFDNARERLNGEIKRRADVLGIFPNKDAITRLFGAILLEQNDERAFQRTRYLTLETIGQMRDDLIISLPALPAR